jgi:predicted PurR-regulated permease PerM
MIDRSESGRLARIAFYGTLFVLAWMMWKIVQPFLLEIGWAVVLAVCLNPVRVRVEPRLGRTKTALVLVLGVLLLAVLPLTFVGYTLYAEGGSGVEYVRQKLQDQGGPVSLFQQVWAWARARAPFLPEEEAVISSVSQSLGRLVSHAAGQTGRVLAGLVSFLFALVIMLSILFFLIRDASSLASALRRLMPFDPEQNDRFLRVASDLVSASVTSTIVIAALQGLIGGTALALLGVKGSVLWGIVMTILAFLPLVGAALVWAPVAIWLAVTGQLVKGVVLALVGILVLGNVDNVVRPLLLAGKSKMSTLVLIISLMGGVSAFGFIGIVLGPLVAALLAAVVESHYARPEEVARVAEPLADPAPAAPAMPGAPAVPPAPVESATPGAPAPAADAAPRAGTGRE